MFLTPSSQSNLGILTESCLQGVYVQYMDSPRFESQFFYSLTSSPLHLSLLIINMGLINLVGHKVVLNIK